MDTLKIVRLIKIINVIAVFLFVPIMILGSLYGLDNLAKNGPTDPWAIATIGYFIAFIFSFLAFKKNYFLYISLFGWLIFGFGTALDSKQAMSENNQLCLDLRADPTCVEDAYGFTCSDMIVPASICEDKYPALFQAKMESAIQDEGNAHDALIVYSNIVDEIISSTLPFPGNENIENRLVAVYNCLGERFGPGTEGEEMATRTLVNKNLTSKQLEKYYAYLASIGRNVNPEIVVAGLPGGNKDFSCEYIGVK